MRHLSAMKPPNADSSYRPIATTEPSSWIDPASIVGIQDPNVDVYKWPRVPGLLSKCPNFCIDGGGANLGALAPRFPQWPVPFSDERNIKFGASSVRW